MKVTWVLPGGEEVVADVQTGVNLMEAAQAHNIAGVQGECGGSLSCATCHVHVDGDWLAKAGEKGDFEEAMLDMADGEVTDASRLSCQIEASDDLDGIRLIVPV
ncbi:ferredoxin, 2Fe-2S [Aliiroseovarius halocynthiae]|uniref:2Fe-2S iron-sulfur cluster binding domain-containing protein n=1 Tax=Aliiroseovarius halocynthiae TaxID=985055 RepID=A0A545SSJ5_9RHOB|nr:2Fe-2S iron-sulfur cluster-binding protein [Aliiroseovarius halocynthiae]TQV67932.1 2Fe-2S iron-sulfur cluster binding domain-containing protein [Aliiroseovarius halocynthiae]SMR73034.1 ferredoxin, 2Fe-2S [Aliiroseovarius halocynthiae]